MHKNPLKNTGNSNKGFIFQNFLWMPLDPPRGTPGPPRGTLSRADFCPPH